MTDLLPSAASPAPPAAAPAGPPDAPPTRSGPLGWLRRHRTALVIAAFLLLAVGVALVTAGGETGQSADYDPANAGADGARAVARVLDDEGVDVEVVRSADDLADAGADSGTTVVVTSSEQLGESTVERLRRDAGGARIVVVDPNPELLRVLDQPGSAGYVDAGDPIDASCDDDLFTGLAIEVDEASVMPGDGCFADTLVTADDLVLLGAPQLLTNDQVLRADNAAVALRLLGQQDRLVWYVASYDDLVGDDGVDFASLVPDWVAPGLALLLLATVALVGWRGRRLGPLATEPLPVVVKAIETTRSRGRLYRRSGDRAHAAETLRAATRARIRTRMRLGPATDEPTLVRDVARHVGRPEAEVGGLLGALGRPPGSDRDLISLAAALAALEEEVRRS
ncbi:DUF4350 domain-containing protein [Nocardioides sp.]|uniref:DUF4350 domain-containing protein n=1 Tax=Nocardioides sp. TaxID=35761 RepID=UPI00271E10D7|nr:DUF4350 domain-containing protein [Nocardioides sp.]MDO9456823.1 DUF4350 domain-containing protein [Nocardioides sp.]